jgi:hypothetical protein
VDLVGIEPVNLLTARKLLILRMPKRSKMPTMPGCLYDFCTATGWHFSAYHQSHSDVQQIITTAKRSAFGGWHPEPFELDAFAETLHAIL